MKFKPTAYEIRRPSDYQTPVVSTRFEIYDNTSSYKIRGVDGLGPTDKEISMVRTSDSRVRLNQRNSVMRQIVMLLDLKPNLALGETVASLRQHFYQYHETRDEYPLEFRVFEGPEVKAYINCYLEKIETPIFAKDPQIQLTFNCLSSNFVGVVDYANLADVDPDGVNGHTMQIPYDGTAKVGFYSGLTLISGTENPLVISTLQNPRTLFEINYPFAMGDIVRFSTVPGSRYIDRWRSGSKISLLPYLKKGAVWPKLYEGVNGFRTASTKWEWSADDTSWIPEYLGV